MLYIITGGKIIYLTVEKEKIIPYTTGCQLRLIHFVNAKLDLFTEAYDSLEVKPEIKCQINFFVVP